MDPAKLARIAMTARRQCLLQPGFATPDECRELLGWALGMQPHLNSQVEGRSFRRVSKLPSQIPLFAAMGQRVRERLGLSEAAVEEPNYGWYLSIADAGSWIDSHRDPTPPGTRQLRCNLFLQLPTSGGLPIIERAPMEVKAGTLLAFFASELGHSSQPVEGKRQRVLLSYGYTVPGNYVLPAQPAMA
jgi:hypothetical protein